MSKLIRIKNLCANIRERNEKRLNIKMQKQEDAKNGIIRTYPEELILIRANLSDIFELKLWQNEKDNV